MDPFARDLLALADTARATASSCGPAAAEYADQATRALRAGGKLLFCGNGGSAADAQHLAAEYVVRFSGSRRSLPALALTTDASVLTACANDIGFAWVFARQVEALGRPGDLLVLHSTSGESENLLHAAEGARKAGVHTVALLARGGGRLRDLVDTALVVPTEEPVPAPRRSTWRSATSSAASWRPASARARRTRPDRDIPATGTSMGPKGLRLEPTDD